MNIICKRTDCKYNKVNNPLQKLTVCARDVVRVSKRGFCESREKRDIAISIPFREGRR